MQFLNWKKLTLLLICFACSKGALQLAMPLTPRLYEKQVVDRYFDDGYLAKAAHYKEARNAASRVTIPADIVVTLLFLFAGPLRLLARRLNASKIKPVVQAILIVCAMLLFESILMLPFTYKFHYLLEREFGFSNETSAMFLADYFKGIAIGLGFAVILAAIFTALYRRFTRGWIYFVGMAFSVFTIFTVYVMPIVIEPLFFDYKPLPAGTLRTKIEELAKTENIRLDNIYEMRASEKTNRTNAYVTGLWGTHRVVLFDTLLKKFNDDEIISVVGHEFGHSVLNHVAIGLALDIASIWIILFVARFLIIWLVRIYPDPLAERNIGALIPIFLLGISLASFFINPIAAYASRHFEAAADYYALEKTHNRGAAVSTEVKLAKDNLSDPNPHKLSYFWYAGHPDTISRIRMAENFKQSR
ncbi:MAG: M48 family metallopeptidase [Spirochaetes bacterium]|nr:M48 family metallopeptidase [Spirochaetota bacterium]